jgi:hypothetical protein
VLPTVLPRLRGNSPALGDLQFQCRNPVPERCGEIDDVRNARRLRDNLVAPLKLRFRGRNAAPQRYGKVDDGTPPSVF